MSRAVLLSALLLGILAAGYCEWQGAQLVEEPSSVETRNG